MGISYTNKFSRKESETLGREISAMTEAIKPFDVFLGNEWQEFQSKGHSMAKKFVNCVTPDPEEVESAIEEMYSVWEKYRHALEKYHQFLKQAEKSAPQVKSENSSSQP